MRLVDNQDSQVRPACELHQLSSQIANHVPLARCEPFLDIPLRLLRLVDITRVREIRSERGRDRVYDKESCVWGWKRDRWMMEEGEEMRERGGTNIR